MKNEINQKETRKEKAVFVDWNSFSFFYIDFSIG